MINCVVSSNSSDVKLPIPNLSPTFTKNLRHRTSMIYSYFKHPLNLNMQRQKALISPESFRAHRKCEVNVLSNITVSQRIPFLPASSLKIQKVGTQRGQNAGVGKSTCHAKRGYTGEEGLVFSTLR